MNQCISQRRQASSRIFLLLHFLIGQKQRQRVEERVLLFVFQLPVYQLETKWSAKKANDCRNSPNYIMMLGIFTYTVLKQLSGPDFSNQQWFKHTSRKFNWSLGPPLCLALILPLFSLHPRLKPLPVLLSTHRGLPQASGYECWRCGWPGHLPPWWRAGVSSGRQDSYDCCLPEFQDQKRGEVVLGWLATFSSSFHALQTRLHPEKRLRSCPVDGVMPTAVWEGLWRAPSPHT